MKINTRNIKKIKVGDIAFLKSELPYFDYAREKVVYMTVSDFNVMNGEVEGKYRDKDGELQQTVFYIDEVFVISIRELKRIIKL